MVAQANGRTKLGFSIFEVDLATNELFKRGQPLHLQEKPFQILAELLAHPGEVVAREELQKKLWPDGTFVDFDRGLNTAVKKLRQALGDSPDAPVFIETLPRKGYRFIAPVYFNGSHLGGPTPSAMDRANSASPPDELEGIGVRTTQVLLVADKNVPFSRLKTNYSSLLVVLSVVIVTVLAGFAARRRSADGRMPDLQHMQITRLTQNGGVREMAISPDGKHVAYALRDGLDQSLWIREVGNGNEVQLLPPDTVNFSGLEFSPDGNSLYFIRSEKSNPVFSYLCRVPRLGGSIEQLIRDADSPVSFSPGGKHFVYTRGYPNRNITEIRIADADGTGDHLQLSMSGHQVYEAGATWSPSGDLITVPLHQIGQQSRFALYVISLRDSKATELFSQYGAIGRPLWLGSGRRLLVTLEDISSHRGQLWTISYPDGKAQRFTNDLSDYSSAIDLTSDGGKVATIVTNEVSNLWVAPATDVSHPYQVTSGEPSLLQVRELVDRRLLALGGGVWTMNSDTTGRLPFAQVHDVSWIESCGRFILLVTNKDGNAVLLRFALEGSNPTAIASGDVLSPTCSAEGRFVYFLNFAHPERVHRISLDDGSSTDIADVVGDTLLGNLSISPDGKFLAYPYQQFSPPLVALAVIPAAGGPPVKTFRVPGAPGRLRWSPEGNALHYLLSRDGATNLWEQALDGRKPRQLTQFNTGQIFDFSWSHDSKRLLLTRGQITRDIVLIEDSQSR